MSEVATPPGTSGEGPPPTSDMAVCDRHRRQTRVACAGCGQPICPKCYVRTPVSLKCRPCAGVPTASRRQRALRFAVPAVVALVAAGAVTAFLSSSAVQGRNEAGPRQAAYVPEPQIGKEARVRGLSFLVTRFECQGKELRDGSFSATALGRFCLLHLRVRNAGSRPELFVSSSQMLVDNRGNEYALTLSSVTVRQASRQLETQVMNPGNEVDRVLVFDVPEGVTPTHAELHAGPRGLGVRVRLGPAVT